MGAWTLALFLVVATAGGGADSLEARRAQAVIWQKKADQLFSQGKYQPALEAAQRSHELFPTARTAYNVALIHMQLGHRETAFQQGVAALNLGPTAADRSLIEALLAEVGPRLNPPRGWLHVVTEPAQAEVAVATIDDRTFPSPHTFAVTDGVQSVRASLGGYRSMERAVEVVAGVRTEITLQLTPAAALDPAPQPVLVLAAPAPSPDAPEQTAPAPEATPGDQLPAQVVSAQHAEGDRQNGHGANGRPLFWTGIAVAGGGALAAVLAATGWVFTEIGLEATGTPWSTRQWIGNAAVAFATVTMFGGCTALGGLATTTLALATGE